MQANLQLFFSNMAEPHPVYCERVPQRGFSNRCSVCYRADIPENCLNFIRVEPERDSQDRRVWVCELCVFLAEVTDLATGGAISPPTLRHVRSKLRKLRRRLRAELAVAGRESPTVLSDGIDSDSPAADSPAGEDADPQAGEEEDAVPQCEVTFTPWPPWAEVAFEQGAEVAFEQGPAQAQQRRLRSRSAPARPRGFNKISRPQDSFQDVTLARRADDDARGRRAAHDELPAAAESSSA